jgi:arylsulfatase A-like enzyme
MPCGESAECHGKWKLVWETAAKPVKWELYDLEADRTEMHDLASANPELVKELCETYTKWAKSTGRKLPGATKGRKKSAGE